MKKNSLNFLGQGLTFDDVLLVPNFSEILPKDTDTQTKLTKKISLKIPLMSAAMDTVTESDMATALANLGGLGIIHKNLSISDQVKEVGKVKARNLPVGAAVGAGKDVVDHVSALVGAGVDIVCVDTAHGHSKGVIEAVKRIRKAFPKLDIIAGNIATGAAAKALITAGANVLKVGIGPGSICTTRIVSGVGVPQLSAVLEVAKVANPSGVAVIADGGLKHSGDIVKALAFGADAVMAGGLFAGTDESPGDGVVIGEQRFKKYRGMGSLGAMQRGSKDRYFQADEYDMTKLVPEGVSGHVPYKGPLKDVVHQLVGGLRAGMGYLGAKNISILRNSSYYTITSAGLKESHTHGIFKTTPAPNYE